MASSPDKVSHYIFQTKLWPRSWRGEFSVACFIVLLQVDTLPSLKWKECSSLPEKMSDAQAVWLGDKLYVGGGEAGCKRYSASLYMYTPTTDRWSRINTPVYRFALTTYRSRLVLVGGKEYVGEGIDGPVTNKLWTLTERGQWSSESLPPMPTKCYHVSAVEFAGKILVAGGHKTNTLEVYNVGQWVKVLCLPESCCSLWMTSTVLDEHWYLMGGGVEEKEVYYASLESLVASCQSSEKTLPSLWKRLPDVPRKYSSIAVFGNRLIAVGGGKYPRSSSIHAYSPHTQSWEHVWDLPFGLAHTCAAILPTEELMVIGGMRPYGRPYDSCVYKARLNETSE